MAWVLIAAAIVCSALAATTLCISHLLSKAKHKNRAVGYQREEIQIDPDKVPEFKPTWPKQ